MNLTAIGSTPYLGEPYNCSLVLLGTDEGHIIVHNPDNDTYLAKIT